MRLERVMGIEPTFQFRKLSCARFRADGYVPTIACRGAGIY
jgi:hypothetical protein